MEYTTLGKTGLKVSVVGLGCGGPSRLGLRDNADSQERAIGIVRQAIDLGVNFIDTAQSYGTEGFVQDPSHQMLQQSLNEDLWDVVMVGFNLLNPSARRTVFSTTRDKRVGV